MKTFKAIGSQLTIYLAFAAMAVMFWSFVFNQITDTSADRKVVLYADVNSMNSSGLAVKLEESMPDNIKMVQVHPFSYAMMDDSGLVDADLYVVHESDLDTYIEDLSPVNEYSAELSGRELLVIDGNIYGILVWDSGSDSGTGTEYIDYLSEEAADSCWLVFSAASTHIASVTGSGDDAALVIATAFADLG